MRQIRLGTNMIKEVPELDDVYAVFEKWLHITDRYRIDAVLAVALSSKVKGIPLWLIIIAPSGDGKNEILLSLKKSPDVKVMHSFTPNTLVSGMVNKKHIDLAPQLDGKIMLIPDMAQILSMSSEDKLKVWSQLRDLYDGFAGKQTGGGLDAKYSGLRVTFIGGSVPKIDSQILIHQDLGTRELLYRSNGETDIDNLLKSKVFENEGFEEQMKEEISGVVHSYLSNVEIRDITMPEEIKKKLFEYSDYMRLMRTLAETDHFTGELINFICPEQPTRCLKQFKKMYCCLKLLDPNYPDERAIEILKRIVHSSIIPIRSRIYQLITECGREYSTKEIADDLKISWKTAYKELNTLYALGLVEKRDIHTNLEYYGKEAKIMWKMNENKILRL